MIVKMIILRLLGSTDDKEKIGVARPEPPLRWFRRDNLLSPVKLTLGKLYSSVQWSFAPDEPTMPEDNSSVQ